MTCPLQSMISSEFHPQPLWDREWGWGEMVPVLRNYWVCQKIIFRMPSLPLKIYLQGLPRSTEPLVGCHQNYGTSDSPREEPRIDSSPNSYLALQTKRVCWVCKPGRQTNVLEISSGVPPGKEERKRFTAWSLELKFSSSTSEWRRETKLISDNTGRKQESRKL